MIPDSCIICQCSLAFNGPLAALSRVPSAHRGAPIDVELLVVHQICARRFRQAVEQLLEHPE